MNPLSIFLIFYIGILIFFSLIYQVLGMELTHEDYEYEGLNIFVAFFLQAFRNSIGDLATPSYDFWLEMKY
jgi:hypothetical protein